MLTYNWEFPYQQLADHALHSHQQGKTKKKNDVSSCKVSSTLRVIQDNGMGIFFRPQKEQIKKYQTLQEVDF